MKVNNNERVKTIAYSIKKKNIDLHEIFSSYDYSGQGFVTYDQVRLIFYKLDIGLTNQDVELLVEANQKILSKEDRIYYPEFISKLYS